MTRTQMEEITEKKRLIGCIYLRRVKTQTLIMTFLIISNIISGILGHLFNIIRRGNGHLESGIIDKVS